MSKATLIVPVLAAMYFLLAAHPAPGQSSLFSVQTTDVVGKGRGYVEADFDAHLSSKKDDRWQSYGFFGVYGISKKSEIGLNAYFVRTTNGSEPIEFQPNFKYQFYNNETTGIAAAAGVIAFIPGTKRSIRDSVADLYAVVSKKFKGEWSPRLTAGGYQLIGATGSIGSKRGLLFGIEQPIHKRVVLVGDWNSARNRFGYVATGLGVTLSKGSYLWTAYYFGNTGRANNSLGIYYGYSF